MNAFEELVASLLRRQGYWTQIGYKVDIDKATKRRLGKWSMPRPEIDIVAYKPALNELLWVECKTYLHSRGVHMGHVAPGTAAIDVFAYPKFRKTVTDKLISQMQREGLVRGKPRVSYCLAAAHVTSRPERERLRSYFKKQGWQLWDEDWIGQELRKLGDLGYEDEIAVVVAQLLDRTKPTVSNGTGKRGVA
jgi:hypothetical protein